MKKTNKNTDLNYIVEYIDSKKIEVPYDEYQKPLNKKRVAQIVADFDENIANEPKVSYRDGHYYVFDGQHTLAARITRNGGHLKVRCKVYYGLTKEQEALLFAEQTGHAAKPTPANRLRARLYAGEKEAVAFKAATESAGLILDLNGSRSEFHILCINTALAMFRRAKADSYKEALGILVMAWSGAPDSLLNKVIIAVVEFVRIFGGKYNPRVLIELLKNRDPREISRRIRADFDRPGYKKYVNQIYELYNDNCGGAKLPLLF